MPPLIKAYSLFIDNIFAGSYHTVVPRVYYGGHVFVLLNARACRYELADDNVFFEAHEGIYLVLYGRIGEHPGSLLEGGCRQERIGRQRRLGNAEKHALLQCGSAAVFDRLLVCLFNGKHINRFAGQKVGGACTLYPYLPEHLAHDDLYVLVVDINALRAVN